MGLYSFHQLESHAASNHIEGCSGVGVKTSGGKMDRLEMLSLLKTLNCLELFELSFAMLISTTSVER